MSALLSPDGLFRFRLWRSHPEGGHGPKVCFIGLNPSTADASEDDPTIRRMMGFAWRFGGRRLSVVNLYAYRATDPRDLARALRLYDLHKTRGDFADALDPVGPDNDGHILTEAHEAETVIACWGAFPLAQARGAAMFRRLSDLEIPVYHFGLTRSGAPKHPLYLRNDAPIYRWGE